MAAGDCSSDQPLVSEVEETKVFVAEKGIHEDVDVKGEMVSDAKILVEGTGIKGHEAVREQCGLADPMETPVEGVVPTEVIEKEPIPEIDEFVVEDEAADGVEGRGICYLHDESTEPVIKTVESEIAKAEGNMEGLIEARGEEPNEDSTPNTVSDAASDVKAMDEIIHDLIAEKKESNEMADGMLKDESNTKQVTEVHGCMEVKQRNYMKDDDTEDPAKETVRTKASEEEVMKPSEYRDKRNAEMYSETVPEVMVESKPEELQTEEGFGYDPDQDKENKPPAKNDVTEQIEFVGIEAELNVAVEDVGSETIVSATPLAEGEASGDYGAKEQQMKDGREGTEPEEKLIVEDAGNGFTEAKETERAADSTDGASNDYPVEYEIPTLEPEKESAAGSKLSELVAMDQAEEGEEPEKAEELSTPENADVSAERIVREIYESQQASRDEHEVGEKRDSVDTQSTTIAMPSKDATNGKQPRKLISRVKSSLGKVRKAIVGGSPSTKIIVVDARLQEKSQ